MFYFLVESAASSHSRLQITVIGIARFRHLMITLSAPSQIVHFNKRKVEVLNRHVIFYHKQMIAQLYSVTCVILSTHFLLLK